MNKLEENSAFVILRTACVRLLMIVNDPQKSCCLYVVSHVDQDKSNQSCKFFQDFRLQKGSVECQSYTFEKKNVKKVFTLGERKILRSRLENRTNHSGSARRKISEGIVYQKEENK